MDTVEETTAEVEATEAQPEDTQGAEQQAPPDFDAIGYEFNAKVADLLTEYENSLPFIYMAKILTNLSMDLMVRQNAIQSRYIMEQVVEKAKKEAEVPASRIHRV